MWGFYKQSHRLIDAIWTTGLTVVVFTIFRSYWPVEAASQDTAVYGAIATIAGALLGFAITAISVQIAFLNGPEFSELRSNPDYIQLFADFKLAIILFGVTTIVALVALLINEKDAQLRGFVMLSLTLWLTFLSGVTMAHALRILWLAIRAHSNANRDQ